MTKKKQKRHAARFPHAFYQERSGEGISPTSSYLFAALALALTAGLVGSAPKRAMCGRNGVTSKNILSAGEVMGMGAAFTIVTVLVQGFMRTRPPSGSAAIWSSLRISSWGAEVISADICSRCVPGWLAADGLLPAGLGAADEATSDVPR